MPKVYLLDYVAGNVRSLVNAIEKVGYEVEWIRSPEDVEKADVSENHELNCQTSFCLTRFNSREGFPIVHADNNLRNSSFLVLAISDTA
jgi:glutamine amidotransferase/cyclase